MDFRARQSSPSLVPTKFLSGDNRPAEKVAQPFHPLPFALSLEARYGAGGTFVSSVTRSTVTPPGVPLMYWFMPPKS